MKTSIKKTFLIINVLVVMLLAGCIERENQFDRRPSDANKTQLYVYNFDGGYGNEWLKKARTRFEEEYKDYVFEEGKRGVQVHISPQKTSGINLKDTIASSKEEIFFLEYVYYDDYINSNLMLDIADIIDVKLPNEEESIKDKLAEQQYKYLNRDGKIYAIPHYAGYDGIVYNHDFFAENNLFFKENWTDVNNPFTSDVNQRTAGPDGVKGTADDGLPTTYEEFFVLCDYIVDKIPGATPLLWNGIAFKYYLTNVMISLFADNEGSEELEKLYALDGLFNTIVEQIDGNNITLKEPFEIIAEENGNEAYGQVGKYYATQFLEKIIRNRSWYDLTTVFSNSYTHLEAQKDFLYTIEYGGLTDYAMLIEGCWWESEADTTITNMVQTYGSSASKYQRDFRWMPLPRISKENSQKPTMLDSIYSYCFIKSTIDSNKIEAAKEFLKFVNSHESLVEFTLTTNTTKALQYTLTEAEKGQMSNFGRSLMTAQENADIFYPYSNAPIYLNNVLKFAKEELFATYINGTLYNDPIEPLRNGRNAFEVFNGYKANGKRLWDGMQK